MRARTDLWEPGASNRPGHLAIGHFQPDVNEVYVVIDELQTEGFPIESLCQSLGVSRSGWYGWQAATPSARRLEDNQLRPLIRKIFLDHRRRYGARRIAAELAAQNLNVSRRRIRRLMDELQLKAIQPRSFKPRTTDSRHKLGYSPNLLIDAPPPTDINQVWVADITYVPLIGQKFLYLSLLMDLFRVASSAGIYKTTCVNPWSWPPCKWHCRFAKSSPA